MAKDDRGISEGVESLANIDQAIDQAAEDGNTGILERLLADIAEIKLRAMPEKRKRRSAVGRPFKQQPEDLAVALRATELELKVHNLLGGVPVNLETQRTALDERVLADAKFFATIAVPKIVDRDRKAEEAVTNENDSI